MQSYSHSFSPSSIYFHLILPQHHRGLLFHCINSGSLWHSPIELCWVSLVLLGFPVYSSIVPSSTTAPLWKPSSEFLWRTKQTFRGGIIWWRIDITPTGILRLFASIIILYQPTKWYKKRGCCNWCSCGTSIIHLGYSEPLCAPRDTLIPSLLMRNSNPPWSSWRVTRA